MMKYYKTVLCEILYLKDFGKACMHITIKDHHHSEYRNISECKIIEKKL